MFNKHHLYNLSLRGITFHMLKVFKNTIIVTIQKYMIRTFIESKSFSSCKTQEITISPFLNGYNISTSFDDTDTIVGSYIDACNIVGELYTNLETFEYPLHGDDKIFVMRYVEVPYDETFINSFINKTENETKRFSLEILTYYIDNKLIDINTIDDLDIKGEVIPFQDFKSNPGLFQTKASTLVARNSRRGCANTIIISKENFTKLFPVVFNTTYVINKVIFADVKDVYFCYQGLNHYDRSFVKINDKIILHPDYARMIFKLSFL